MIIPDVNVLLYAVNSSASHHLASRDWLETSLNATETIGFDWVVLLGFLKISTNRTILPSPLSTSEAWDIIDGWIRQSVADVITPGPGHAVRLRALTETIGAGNLTTDAHIAAMALGLGARICSYDRDFERFDGIVRIEPTR